MGYKRKKKKKKKNTPGGDSCCKLAFILNISNVSDDEKIYEGLYKRKENRWFPGDSSSLGSLGNLTWYLAKQPILFFRGEVIPSI